MFFAGWLENCSPPIVHGPSERKFSRTDRGGLWRPLAAVVLVLAVPGERATHLVTPPDPGIHPGRGHARPGYVPGTRYSRDSW